MKLKFKAFAAFMLAAVVSLALFLSPSEAAKARQLRYYALDVGQGDCSLFVLPDGRAARRTERSLRRGAALEREKDRQLPKIVRRAQNRPARRVASARGPHRRDEGASVENSRQADMGLGLQPRLEGPARLLSDDKGQENPLRAAQARVRREAGRRDARGARPREAACSPPRGRSRARAATRTTTG